MSLLSPAMPILLLAIVGAIGRRDGVASAFVVVPPPPLQSLVAPDPYAARGTMSSSRLFFSQRIGRFGDVDPPVSNLGLVLPLISLQTIGPVASLVVCAAYLKVLLNA